MFSFYENTRYGYDHIYTDEDFEKIRLSGTTIKINNTIFANGPSCLGVTQLKPHEYQQYLIYLQKIEQNLNKSTNNTKKKPKKEPKEKKEPKVKLVKDKKVKKEKASKNDVIKLGEKTIKISDIEKIKKAGATLHISF
jgi:hypothetical protein